MDRDCPNPPCVELIGCEIADESGAIELTFHPHDLQRNSIGQTFSLRIGLGVRSIKHVHDGLEYIIDFKHLFLGVLTEGVDINPDTYFVDPTTPLKLKQKRKRNRERTTRSEFGSAARTAARLSLSNPSVNVGASAKGKFNSERQEGDSDKSEIIGMVPIVEYTSRGWDIGHQNRGDPRRDGILWGRYFERDGAPLCEFIFRRGFDVARIDFELRVEAFDLRVEPTNPQGGRDVKDRPNVLRTLASKFSPPRAGNESTSSSPQSAVLEAWRSRLGGLALSKEIAERMQRSRHGQQKGVLATAALHVRKTLGLSEDTPIERSAGPLTSVALASSIVDTPQPRKKPHPRHSRKLAATVPVLGSNSDDKNI